MEISNYLSKLGIEVLNEMQTKSFDIIAHTNKDVVILSPTGSGKTLAYLLPLIDLLNPALDEIQAVVIVPGRELALQSSELLKQMGTALRSCACYGGRMTMEEHRIIKNVLPHVIFATPGRLNDHLDKGNIIPEGIRYLVIDEFDKCLQMGFEKEMNAILVKLSHIKKRILLSATDAELIPNFVNLGHAEKINYVDERTPVSDRVNVYQVSSPVKDKLQTLSDILCSLEDERTLVFLNYRESVERTAQYLQDAGFSISMFHGGLDQKMREHSLYKFANGSANILVSTDLASRGLDISGIKNIIHYHLPENEDVYIHRVGRTARWEATGKAFFIFGPEEHLPDYIHEEVAKLVLPTHLPAPALPKMCTLYIGKGKKDKLSKGDIVGFLCKNARIEGNAIGRIDVKERYTYVAVDRKVVQQVLQRVAGQKIKGVKTVVELVK